MIKYKINIHIWLNFGFESCLPWIINMFLMKNEVKNFHERVLLDLLLISTQFAFSMNYTIYKIYDVMAHNIWLHGCCKWWTALEVDQTYLLTWTWPDLITLHSWPGIEPYIIIGLDLLILHLTLHDWAYIIIGPDYLPYIILGSYFHH